MLESLKNILKVIGTNWLSTEVAEHFLHFQKLLFRVYIGACLQFSRPETRLFIYLNKFPMSLFSLPPQHTHTHTRTRTHTQTCADTPPPHCLLPPTSASSESDRTDWMMGKQSVSQWQPLYANETFEKAFLPGCVSWNGYRMQMSSRLMRDETTQKNLNPNYNNSIYTTYSRIVQVWNFSVSMVFIHHVSKV